MPLCCGFTLFINNSLAKCVFYMFDVAGKTLLLKRKQKTFPLISLIMKGNVSIVKKKNKFLQKLNAIIEEISLKGSMCIVCFVVVVLLKSHKKFGMSAMHT